MGRIRTVLAVAVAIGAAAVAARRLRSGERRRPHLSGPPAANGVAPQGDPARGEDGARSDDPAGRWADDGGGGIGGGRDASVAAPGGVGGDGEPPR